MKKLFVYWLQTDDDRKAIVISSESKTARTLAQIHAPTGGWEKAKLRCLGLGCPVPPPGVVFLKGESPMKKHGTRRWYNSYPRDFVGFMGWLLFTAGWLVLQGLGRIEEFVNRRKEDR